MSFRSKRATIAVMGGLPESNPESNERAPILLAPPAPLLHGERHFYPLDSLQRLSNLSPTKMARVIP